MKKWLAATLITGALVSGTVALSAPASASLSMCPTNKVCVFAESDYVGLLGYRSGGQGLANMSSGANDKMSSWSNKTAYSGAWYKDANGGGSCYNMNAKTNNHWVGLFFDNRASSWRTDRAC